MTSTRPKTHNQDYHHITQTFTPPRQLPQYQDYHYHKITQTTTTLPRLQQHYPDYRHISNTKTNYIWLSPHHPRTIQLWVIKNILTSLLITYAGGLDVTVKNLKGSVEKLSPRRVSKMLTLSRGAQHWRTVCATVHPRDLVRGQFFHTALRICHSCSDYQSYEVYLTQILESDNLTLSLSTVWGLTCPLGAVWELLQSQCG